MKILARSRWSKRSGSKHPPLGNVRKDRKDGMAGRRDVRAEAVVLGCEQDENTVVEIVRRGVEPRAADLHDPGS